MFITTTLVRQSRFLYTLFLYSLWVYKVLSDIEHFKSFIFSVFNVNRQKKF